MGIEATGDPLWWDTLTDEQRQAVLGMLWREWRDQEDEMDDKPQKRGRRPSPRQPIPPPPPGSTREGWEALMRHPGLRIRRD